MLNRKALALLAIFAITPLSAQAWSGLYVFGDSLSDVGNVKTNVGVPIAPYDNGYFSNGPTWVQTLGNGLGVGPTTASANGGTNYAWGGARTGTDQLIFGTIPLPSLVTQANNYLLDAGGVADSNGLYVVWGGGNDVRDLDAGNSASDITSIVTSLAAAGATDFLIPNLPDIGLTPESIGLGPVAQALATAETIAHNIALEAAMLNLAIAMPSISITFFDVFSLFNDMLADPAAFGFSNADSACFEGALGVGGNGVVCTNPDDYVFWDGIHPTAAAHALLGREALAQVVPVPAALPLFLSGLGLFGLLGRRRRNG